MKINVQSISPELLDDTWLQIMMDNMSYFLYLVFEEL